MDGATNQFFSDTALPFHHHRERGRGGTYYRATDVSDRGAHSNQFRNGRGRLRDLPFPVNHRFEPRCGDRRREIEKRRRVPDRRSINRPPNRH